jgi:hypothetical protein
MLYTDDDDDFTRNAVKTVSRDNRGQSTLRPVSVRPVGVARQPAYAQPAYAQPGYAQPGYAQPGYAQPGYAQPGYVQPGFGGYPGFPGYPDPRLLAQQPWGWNGPNGQVFYGTPWNGSPYGAGPWSTNTSSTPETIASAVSSVFEIGASLVAAFQTLPAAPNSEESTVLSNVTDYQRKLAEHAKSDERTRVVGTTAGRAAGLAVKLLMNRNSNAVMAPRWF